MISAFINDLVSFFNSVLSLVLLYWFLKVILFLCFKVRFRLPRFRNVRNIQVALGAKRYNKTDYEFKKFKYETRLKYKNEYRLERLRIKTNLKMEHKNSSKIASKLPDFLKVVK